MHARGSVFDQSGRERQRKRDALHLIARGIAVLEQFIRASARRGDAFEESSNIAPFDGLHGGVDAAVLLKEVHGAQQRSAAELARERLHLIVEQRLVHLAQRFFAEELGDLMHVVLDARVIERQIAVISARIDDVDLVALEVEIERALLRASRILEINRAHAAQRNAYLIEQAAGLAEVLVLRKLGDKGLFLAADSAAVVELILNLGHQDLIGGRRGDARALEHPGGHDRRKAARAEAAVALVIRLEVNLNFAHALQIVTNRTLGALNLVGQVVLAAGSNTRASDLTDSAVSVLSHEGHDVFVLNVSHLSGACSLRTLREYGGSNCVYLGDIAHDELGDGQQVGTEVTQSTAASQLVDVAPGDREGLVEQLVLIVGAGEAHDLAESAGLNELTNVSVCRVLGVVEANIVYNALLLSQLSQLLGLLSGDGQRLLAVYVLAVLQSSLSNYIVESVRGSDINQVYVRVGNYIVPVGGDALEADLLLCGLCSLFVSVSYDLEGCGAVVRTKQHLSVSQCRGMSLAHPAGTYQTNTDFFHDNFLLDI